MKKGFTLIELMIIMAIIGILAAVLLPALAKYKDKHRDQQGIQSGSGQQSTLPENNIKVPEPQTKIECVDGYKVIGGKQMVDSSGHGIYCN